VRTDRRAGSGRQHKRDARKAEAARIQQAITNLAAADSELSPRAHRQLDIHLQIAGTRGWHRASVARQAELSGIGERAVQFANQELIARGYLTRDLTSGTTTAIWMFTPRSPVETSENAHGSPVFILGLDSQEPLDPVSARGASSAKEAHYVKANEAPAGGCGVASDDRRTRGADGPDSRAGGGSRAASSRAWIYPPDWYAGGGDHNAADQASAARAGEGAAREAPLAGDWELWEAYDPEACGWDLALEQEPAITCDNSRQEPVAIPAPAVEQPKADLNPADYSLECVRYEATGVIAWRLWNDTTDQIAGEYPTEAAALAAIENPQIAKICKTDDILSTAPAHQDAENEQVIKTHVADTIAPASDIDGLDMAEIDRMVAEIQAVDDARRDERREPQSYWEAHEAIVWRESHPVAPQSPDVYQQRAAQEAADRARTRAAWDALGDDPNALGARLGKQRGRLKKYPQSRRALEWQIHELHDRLAALTPVSEAMGEMRAPSPARARRAPVAQQEGVVSWYLVPVKVPGCCAGQLIFNPPLSLQGGTRELITS
jgi:hypothetical protein